MIYPHPYSPYRLPLWRGASSSTEATSRSHGKCRSSTADCTSSCQEIARVVIRSPASQRGGMWRTGRRANTRWMNHSIFGSGCTTSSSCQSANSHPVSSRSSRWAAAMMVASSGSTRPAGRWPRRTMPPGCSSSFTSTLPASSTAMNEYCVRSAYHFEGCY